MLKIKNIQMIEKRISLLKSVRVHENDLGDLANLGDRAQQNYSQW